MRSGILQSLTLERWKYPMPETANDKTNERSFWRDCVALPGQPIVLYKSRYHHHRCTAVSTSGCQCPANGIKIGWMHPLPGETYQAGKEAQVEWLVLGDENTYSQSYSTTGYLYLKSDISGQSYTLQENLPIFNTTTSVTYPAAPGNDYQIIFETEYGLFYSGNFTLI
ncbi:hypothetical protein BJV77DRAFT_1151237 [Russula vinacea]|nr:hypothetical protein BJV77DRAFT_1151237 [Russula vinacea]